MPSRAVLAAERGNRKHTDFSSAAVAECAREVNCGFNLTVPPRLTPRSALIFAANPRWTLDYVVGDSFSTPDLETRLQQGTNVSMAVSDYFNTMLDQSLDWKMAERIPTDWGGQF